MSVIKYLMFFFNFLFWLSGLALIIVGAIIRDKYGDYFSYADGKFANAAVFLIIVGVIVFVIGFLGCCGAIKENYCMVTTFAVLLGIIFLLEIVAGSLGFAYKSKVEDKATDALDRAVKDYQNKDQPGAKKIMDWAQQRFECCGSSNASNYADFVSVNGTEPADYCKKDSKPVSCHRGDSCNGTIFGEGCKQGFVDFVENNLVVIGAVALGIAFIQLLGIIFACCLMKAIKGEYEVV